MSISLKEFEPKGRDNCFCGSGERYKNCCRGEWPKYDFSKKNICSGSPAKLLKILRAHITWYRLCHLAHTVPLVRGNCDDEKILDLDIKAMREMLQQARRLYGECGIINNFPYMLSELSDAIADVRWKWSISCEEAFFNLSIKKDCAEARAVLAKYKWQSIDSSELLEVYLEAYADNLVHIDTISIASKVIELTDSESSKLHYRFLISVQYFLLNETERAEKLAREAIEIYEAIPVSMRNAHGRWMLCLAIKQLGQILGDEEMLRKAIELLIAEVGGGNWKSKALADAWYQVGECYHLLREFYMAEKLYSRSILIEPSPLTSVYLAKVQLDLRRPDRAKEILDSLISTTMSKSNFFDYAIIRCNVALFTKKISDINFALELIKKVSTVDPYFKDLIQSLIVSLYDLKISKSSLQTNSILARINRYVTLNPNLGGFGVNFNAMIDDYLSKKAEK